MKPAIQIENLGKKYLISHQTKQRYQTLAEQVADTGRGLIKRLRHPFLPNPGSSEIEEFWALEDINFEVHPGDRVGIIGRNGAGKSTLLKILSRITEPTTGRVRISGQVASLLEVGTGFHPELTGRENIFLNGAILGMKKREIQHKFDEIVDFSGIEKFLDTPVKRYSSGMYVRLAFSVAAHLEPEVLIVDEVLAVGDSEFQNKCLGRMENVSQQGRTILFVSHNMQAVKRLCHTGILLRRGHLVERGDISSVVDAYLSLGRSHNLNQDVLPEMHRFVSPSLEVYRIELINENDEMAGQIFFDEIYRLRLHYKINAERRNYSIAISVRSVDGELLGAVSSWETMSGLKCGLGAKYCVEAKIPNIFTPGRFNLEIKVKSGQEVADLIEGIRLEVLPVSKSRGAPTGWGLVRMNATWRYM